MKPILYTLMMLAALAILLAGAGAFYEVDETEQVIITQFGKPVGKAITTAGLKWKLPFIQAVNRLEKRALEWDGRPTEIPTKDKTYLVVDAFARWRIHDPETYFLALRDERSAQSRLEDILGSEIRNSIAKHELIEIVRTDKNRKPKHDDTLARGHGEAHVPQNDARAERHPDVVEGHHDATHVSAPARTTTPTMKVAGSRRAVRS